MNQNADYHIFRSVYDEKSRVLILGLSFLINRGLRLFYGSSKSILGGGFGGKFLNVSARTIEQNVPCC